LRHYGSPKRTVADRKAAVFMRLVMGAGQPVTVDEMVAAGYRRDDAEREIARVRGA
jgi:hypothetical protein